MTGTTKKTHKSKDGWLGAGGGSITDVHKFFKWIDDGHDPDDAVSLEHLDGILVSPDGTVFIVESDLNPYEMKADFYVGGSGGELATGAMAAGATPEDAVKIAIKYDISCGGPIQKVKLGK